jgi:hypothetical protein
MKYVKPSARELSEVPFATGACASGTIVNQSCVGGYSNVGPCREGTTAGQGCTAGPSPVSFAPCTPGLGATNCGTGMYAGIA